MDIKQLINFITVVEEGNITKAANKLHMSQPPLSNQMKQLEEELGVKLIERGSRKISLTDVGNLLYNRGKDLINMYESTLNEVEDFRGGVEGVLKIGVISTCSKFLPRSLISLYTKKYPRVRFELYEGNTYEVIDMVEKGIVDIGVVRTPCNNREFSCIELKKDPMVAVLKNDSDFLDDKGLDRKISLLELNDKPLIIYRRYEKLIIDVFNKNNIKLNIYCLNDDSRTTVSWSEFGLGIGIVPKSIIDTDNSNVSFFEIDCEDLNTTIIVVWKNDKYLPKTVTHFIEMIREQY